MPPPLNQGVTQDSSDIVYDNTWRKLFRDQQEFSAPAPRLLRLASAFLELGCETVTVEDCRLLHCRLRLYDRKRPSFSAAMCGWLLLDQHFGKASERSRQNVLSSGGLLLEAGQ